MREIIYGYHITSKSKAKEILASKNFDLKPFNFESLKIGSKVKSPLPGDLGTGIYFFVDDDRFDDAKSLASAYYNVHKRHTYKDNPALLKCELSIEKKFNELNMNKHENIKGFNKIRNQNYKKAIRIFNENITSVNAKNRMNLDGIFIQMFIERVEESGVTVDYVAKDSFTPVDEYYSNVANGSELCVRNKDMILLIN